MKPHQRQSILIIIFQIIYSLTDMIANCEKMPPGLKTIFFQKIQVAFGVWLIEFL